MNRIIALVYFILITSLVYVGCSELESNITSVTKSGIHGKGVMDTASSNFHGKYFDKMSFKDCQECHAKNYSGGLTPVNCGDTQCHPGISIHTELTGLIEPSSQNFHGKFLAKIKWNMQNCKQCHGNDYGGGTTSSSCLGCHNQPSGPEACNTCHGAFANPERTAPPTDLSNNISNQYIGVGAHVSHLYENSFGAKTSCNECHAVPSFLNAPGHIDASPKAEIIWGDLAKKRVDGVDSLIQPTYDYSTGSCSNVYCHGYFKNGNVGNVVKWTGNAECGSCHGNPITKNPLPGGTHPQLANCQICHSRVVQVNGSSITIINRELHINGEINFN